jgi:long-chain acyl-CoA synthetase
MEYLLGDSEAKVIFAGDQEQVDKVLEVRDKLPNLQKIIYWEPKGLWDYDMPSLMSYKELQELGREYEQAHPGAFEQMIDETCGSDIFALLYTSGTTRITESGVAMQMGVIHTYDSLLENARWILKEWPLYTTDKYVSALPGAWAGQITDVLLALAGALEVQYPERMDTLFEDLREVGPSAWGLIGPMWDMLASQIQSKINETSAMKRFTYNLCLPVGYKMADLEFAHQKPNLFWKAARALAHLACFRPLLDKLGLLKVRVAFQSGSCLGGDTFRYFHALGVPVKQIYGSSECGLVCLHKEGDVDPETVGMPINPDWVKISPEGEILIRSPLSFSGYHKGAEATRGFIDEEGWLHPGDAGYINEHGHLVFYDRFKDLTELPSGRKFSPTYIETKLRFSPYVKENMVMGGKDKPFVSALINIDFDNVGDWAEDHHISYTTMVDLSQKDQVYDLILKDVNRVNRYLPDDMKIRKFVNLHKEFDPDEAEITRSGKLRRKFVEQRYEGIIDTIYEGKEGYEVETPVKYRDGRTGVVRATVKVKSVE